MQTIATFLGFPLELSKKTILLNISHTYIVEHRGSIVELSRECPPCWLAFLVTEVARQADGREKALMVLPNGFV